MPRKKKTNHQLSQIRCFREQEAINKHCKKIMDIWARDFEQKKSLTTDSLRKE